MYITCQKCDTVFRLDERLLKPTGSKVRCSQCGNIFTAVPPSPAKTEADPLLETMPGPAAPRNKEAEEAAPAQEIPQEVFSESEDLQIDFDFDAEIDIGTSAVQATEPETVTDILEELDLDTDFTLNVEEPVSTGATPTPDLPPEPLLEMELDGLFLEEDSSVKTTHEPPVADSLNEDFSAALKNFENRDQPIDDSVTLFVDMSDNPADQLNLDDLDLELELAEELHNNDPLEAETDPGLDFGLDPEEELHLHLEETETPVAGENMLTPEKDMQGEVDELNFSDLEGILESEDDSVASADRFEEELSLDLFDDNESSAVAENIEEPEELTLELDTTYKEQHLRAEESELTLDSAEDEAEIDLSDLELMLEGDSAAPAPPAWSDDKQAAPASESVEIDLSELEAAIEEVETRIDSDTAEEKVEDQELSLHPDKEELHLEDDAAQVIDLELDSLANLAIENEKPIIPETLNSSDMELEFHVEDEAQENEPYEAEPATVATNTPTPDIESFPIPLPALEELDDSIDNTAPQTKKKSKASTLVLAIIILMALTGFGLYYAATQMGITIPFISDYLNPVEQDPAGVRHLSTPEINSKFFENSQAGRLFVISGTIRNGFPDARTNIRLQGKLYTKGKKLAKAENVYAGIIIDDQEIATGSAAEIKKRLETAPGPHEPAARVLPNQSLPFMVVFSNLPDTSELDEFAVAPIGSTPIK